MPPEEAKAPQTQEELLDIMSEPNPDVTNRSVVTEEVEPEAEAPAKEEKPAPPPAPEKKPEPVAKQEDIDMMDKLDRELAKPEGHEDLNNFSEREKAYFWSMRRDRRARQKAEEERDGLRFREIKREAEEKARKEAEAPKEEDPFAGREDDDFLTVKEAKKLQESLKAKKKEEAPKPIVDVSNPMVAGYLKTCEEAAAAKFDDFPEVMETVQDITKDNPSYQQKVLEAMQRGDNPAIALYHLIKGDPDFPKHLPVAKARLATKQPPKTEAPKAEGPSPEEQKKMEEAKKKEEALKSTPPKTSGHASGSEAGVMEGYTPEQLMHMSEKEFAKIPKKIREEFLKKYA